MKNQIKKSPISRGLIAKILLIVYDVFVVNLSYLLALWLRFDCEINVLMNTEPEFIEAWIKFVPINTVCCLIVFSIFQDSEKEEAIRN